jgi:hypothetical protein
VDPETGPIEHVERHRDGSLRARGWKTPTGLACGYWEWFRKDGTLLRSGQFENGVQTGAWTTYDSRGEPYKVTRMKAGAGSVTRLPTD